MLDHNLVAKSTAWEIQAQLDAVEKRIENLEFEEKKLKFARNDLRIALCLKLNGQHKFKFGRCKCGAIEPDEKITSFKGL